MSVHPVTSKQSEASECEPVVLPVQNPVEVAKIAGLRYVTDKMPGIRRERVGEQFTYIGTNGKLIGDEGVLKRIRSLAIPPAWTDVWICPSPRGHIQATGRDAKGRKQYRYHPEWRKVRDETKYDKMLVFGMALPAIRKKVALDLQLPGLPREKILAILIDLLDITAIRVGNEEYARENESYGLTTLRNKHVKVSGSNIRLHFRGKGGKEHTYVVRDKRLARIVKRLQDLPGHELFEYLDEHDEVCHVESADVNEYLREITKEDFTAKDFRTWWGTVIAVEALKDLGEAETQTQAKKNITEAIKEAADHLGNTPAICRKCYVHPAVLDAYLNRRLLQALKGQEERGPHKERAGLHPEEVALMEFLEGEQEKAV
ncbi:MAG TPA: DNA topoisomerase IB [Ktedonobacteraceae bacterium]|nr:DNA topoisomerase IB [Ktedonobacteraceae bacterium]